MAARTVAVRLTAEVGNYIQGMKNAAAATRDLTSSTLDTAEKNKQAMTQIGLGFAAIGAVAAAGVGMAVKRFADFDAAMSGVQAATHASAKEMHALREAAIDAGARTAFSASEAADGIEQLAKAGVSTAHILNGGLNGALDLAAAGGLEVGAAAEIAATAMTQFRLSGQKVPHIADLLAAAAGKAQGDVSDMGMALKQAGLVASQTGLSIEETTAGLASFAAAGLLGSDAGTSMKSMLQRLTPQSAEAAQKMSDLGISAYDAQGNFIGLSAFAQNLQDSLKGLTVEQRNSAMATIFGSDAVRAASVLYQQGSAGISAWTEKVNDAGYAQETAAIKLDNLKGDLEEFSGSFETALIRTGEAGDGLARKTVQSATAMVNAYSDLPPAAQAATLGLGGFTAVAGSAAGAFLLLVPRIAETRTQLRTLSAEMPRTTSALSGVGKAAGIAGVLLTAATAWNALTNAMTASRTEAAPAAGALTKSISEFLKTGKSTGELARIMGGDFENLSANLRRAGESGNALTKGFWQGSKIKESQAEIAALDQALAAMVSAGHAEQAAQFFDEMAMAAGRDGVSIGTLQERLPGYTDAVAAAAAETELAAGAQGAMAGATGEATDAIAGQAASLVELMEQVQSLSNQILGLRGSERDFEAAVDSATDSVKENGRTLDINTEKGRANEAALDAIASSANDVLSSMVEAGQPLDSVSAKLAVQRDRLVAAATAFGMTEGEANAYADSVLRIPTQAQTTVHLYGADAAISKVQTFREAIAGIPSMRDVTVRYNETTGIQVRRPAGGQILERASGGWAVGPGTATSDSIPARLSNGEFVVNARSAGQNAALLEAINSNRFASGGWVSGRSVGSGGVSAPTVNVGETSVRVFIGDEEITGRVQVVVDERLDAAGGRASTGSWD